MVKLGTIWIMETVLQLFVLMVVFLLFTIIIESEFVYKICRG